MSGPPRCIAAAVAAVALLAAGCGGDPEPELYRLEPTQSCLEEAGLEVATDDLDFVASTASEGAMRVELGANNVTISFGEDEAEAERTATAYENFAGPRIPIDHVLFRQGNAVLVWGAPPTDEERARVVACLSG